MKPQPTYELIQNHMHLIAPLSAISHFAFYIILAFGIGYEDDFLLRITCTSLCAGWWFLSTNTAWTWRETFYFESSLIFVLPFTFTYLLLLNNANVYWFGSAIVGGLLLGLFSRLMLASIGYVIGAILATLFYNQVYGLDQNVFKVSLQAHLATYFLMHIAAVMQYAFERTNLKLNALKQEAERANTTKTKFLAAASHDLRQPLHALGLYLDTLHNELTTDRQTELASKMRNTINALNELFERLLDISKLDAGIVESNAINCSVSRLFKRLEVRFMPLAASEGLQLKFSDNELALFTDPLLVERILDNLISNAIRYTHTGSINVDAVCDTSATLLRVSDTGPGIAIEEQEVIFDEFHQLQNPERDRSKGIGLGLSIVKRLCELLNYRLELESELGQGSCFSLYVPSGDPEMLPRSIIPSKQSAYSLNGLNVLVIDDEAEIRDAMSELLRSWGCMVQCAGTTDSAIETVKNNYTPGLIISDFRLPGTSNGIDTIHDVIQILGVNVPAILITGDTSPDRLKDAANSGYKLLHKPVNAGKLRVVVNHLLSQNPLGKI